MCKNAGTPCPGCKTLKNPDAAWMFFTDDERHSLEPPSKNEAPVRSSAHP